MFNNPGAKIKGLAKTFFWIEVVAFAVAVLAMSDELFESMEGILIGVLILAVGVGIAYIGALFLAAFGELVESNTQIKETSKEILQKLNVPAAPAAPQQPLPNKAFCPACGSQVSADHLYCSNCGSKM